jgi:hypothetical protein
LFINGIIGKYRIGIKGFILIAIAIIIVLIIVQQWIIYINIAILPFAIWVCVRQI